MFGEDISTILKLAGLGLGIALIDIVLKEAGKDKFVTFVHMTGVTIGAIIVAQYILKLFQTVQTIFMF